MLDLAVKVAEMVVTFLSTVVKALDLVEKYKERHQKATAPTKEKVANLMISHY